MITPLESTKEHTKTELYSLLRRQCSALLSDETDLIANSANFSALLYSSLPDINWAGFYFYKNGELVLGPFQGKPACVRIPLGKGVCGTAAATRTSLVVPNVHAFEGHIACDAASNSEIVIPLVFNDELYGVLDIDSPLFDRFDETDLVELEYLTSLLLHNSVL